MSYVSIIKIIKKTEEDLRRSFTFIQDWLIKFIVFIILCTLHQHGKVVVTRYRAQFGLQFVHNVKQGLSLSSPSPIP